MTRAVAVTLTWGVALVLVAALVVAGGDSTTLVPPPEAVGESFVAELLAGEVQKAMRYVDPLRVSPTTVQRGADALRLRTGPAVPNDAGGERSSLSGDRATADVRVNGHAGRFEVTVMLRRTREGRWLVSAWN